VSVHVAELGDQRYDHDAQQQLRRLEPVEVGIINSEMCGEIRDERHIEPLKDSADHLDEKESADETEHDRRGLSSQQCHERMLQRPVSELERGEGGCPVT
jgi:hypothetical protein